MCLHSTEAITNASQTPDEETSRNKHPFIPSKVVEVGWVIPSTCPAYPAMAASP